MAKLFSHPAFADAEIRVGGIFNILESSRFGRMKMTSHKLSTLLKVRERGNEADKKVASDRTFGES